MKRSLLKNILSVLVRFGVTVFAFWWIFRKIDGAALRGILGSLSIPWIIASILFYLMTQAGCIFRWGLLAPRHPALKWTFLANSYLVAAFFNMFLPTTVGGDVIRGYDLIKKTGEWKSSLASVLADRLAGFVGFFLFALAAWIVFPAARQDPLVRAAFGGFAALVAVTFGVLGSRRAVQWMLTPFSKIGLGQLQSHARQFQEALQTYLGRPQLLMQVMAASAFIQTCVILMFWAAGRALHRGQAD